MPPIGSRARGSPALSRKKACLDVRTKIQSKSSQTLSDTSCMRVRYGLRMRFKVRGTFLTNKLIRNYTIKLNAATTPRETQYQVRPVFVELILPRHPLRAISGVPARNASRRRGRIYIFLVNKTSECLGSFPRFPQWLYGMSSSTRWCIFSCLPNCSSRSLPAIILAWWFTGRLKADQDLISVIRAFSPRICHQRNLFHTGSLPISHLRIQWSERPGLLLADPSHARGFLVQNYSTYEGINHRLVGEFDSGVETILIRCSFAQLNGENRFSRKLLPSHIRVRPGASVRTISLGHLHSWCAFRHYVLDFYVDGG